MKVFVTGASGFVTGAVARALVARGDTVRALVRDPRRVRRLEGIEPIYGDLANEHALRTGMQGADAVIHGAAMYEVGLNKKQREAMHEANVRGTAHVLSTARAAGIPRTVYISTIAVFGNTRGQVVDETYERADPTYTSYYEETKVRAHEIAQGFIADGLPVVIVQPGQVYGPHDHSGFGGLLAMFARGRLPVVPFPDLGLNLTYCEDIAAGIIRALDAGQPGRSYVMGGEIVRSADAFATLARVVGRPVPRWQLPYGVLEAAALFRGQLNEVISSAKGVTFWATDERAKKELGYTSRTLEDGFKETYRS
ncbi:MAG: NAD-dependent epimerase/dehydratase family protein [Chloroflexota bacterium]|nr:NAD-dependent epimerase/dehydratase family protein [Chloroflexota bacterium]